MIMTPDHEKWEEFCNRLEGEEGCNFREGESGSITWDCGGRMNKEHAKKLLEDYDVDVFASLLYFEDHGGHCDCEILWNVHN